MRRRELDAPYMLISLRALCALCGSLPPVFRSCLWFHPCIYLIDLHWRIDTHGNRSTDRSQPPQFAEELRAENRRRQGPRTAAMPSNRACGGEPPRHVPPREVGGTPVNPDRRMKRPWRVVPEALSKLSRGVYKCVFVAAKVLSRTDDGLTVTGIEPILSTFLISSSKSRRGNVGSNRSGKGWFGAVHCVRVA